MMLDGGRVAEGYLRIVRSCLVLPNEASTPQHDVGLPTQWQRLQAIVQAPILAQRLASPLSYDPEMEIHLTRQLTDAGRNGKQRQAQTVHQSSKTASKS